MDFGARAQLLRDLEYDAGRLVDRLRALATHTTPFSDEIDDEVVLSPGSDHFERMTAALKGGASMADELHQAVKAL